mgnify:CR=1 FL=1
MQFFICSCPVLYCSWDNFDFFLNYKYEGYKQAPMQNSPYHWEQLFRILHINNSSFDLIHWLSVWCMLNLKTVMHLRKHYHMYSQV